MTTSKWTTQFANDSKSGFELCHELLEDGVPQGQIERDLDGNLYLAMFQSPGVRVPFRWLVGLSEKGETLPRRSDQEE